MSLAIVACILPHLLTSTTAHIKNYLLPADAIADIRFRGTNRTLWRCVAPQASPSVSPDLLQYY
jgi:hypothetical protein